MRTEEIIVTSKHLKLILQIIRESCKAYCASGQIGRPLSNGKIQSFNKRQKMAKLTKMLGTFEDFMDSEELESMRQDET